MLCFNPNIFMIDDIALGKFDSPIKSNKISPICLPDINYKEIGKKGFIAGHGVIKQEACTTVGHGPAAFTQCASGSRISGGTAAKLHWFRDKDTKEIKNAHGACSNSLMHPSQKPGSLCRVFQSQYKEV